MHMVSKKKEKDLNAGKMETVTTSRNPMTLITTNGEVQTHEEATVGAQELDIFLTMKFLEDMVAVFIAKKTLRWTRILTRLDRRSNTTSQWKRDSDTLQYGELRSYRGSKFTDEFFLKLAFFNIYDTFKAGNWSSYVFLNLVYLTNHDIFNCDASVDIQERRDLCGTDHHPVIMSSERVERQERRDPCSSGISEEQMLTGPTKNQKPNKNEDHDQECGDLCHSDIPEWLKILWMTKFRNTATHWPVLLMNYL